MQLIKKLFGKPPADGVGAESVQFHESDSGFGPESRNAPRRELVQVVLRDVMRRHGIPSAWIDCRILSMVNRNSRPGLHVQLIVRDGIDRLLTYVPAFQTGFMEEIVRFDPRVEDWLFSLSWQFYNLEKFGDGMPDPATWAGTTTAAAALTAAPTRGATPTVAPSVAHGVPAAARPAAATAQAQPAPRANPPVNRPPIPAARDLSADDDLMEDLQALYAIRDAAIGQGRPVPTDENDFQSTQPGADDSVDPRPGRRR